MNLFRSIFPEALFWQEFSFVGSKGFEPKLYAWASSLSLSGSNYGIRTRISRIIQSLPLLTAFLKSRNSLNWGKNWSCCCPRRRPNPLASSFQNEPTFWLSYLGFLFFVFYLRARFFAKCSSCDILSTIKVFRKMIFVCFKLNCSKGECCSSREVLWSSNL